MSLFVGNISRGVDIRDLDRLFSKYGKCRVDKRNNFAFVEYDDEINAEEAKVELNGKRVGGFAINVEWSKRSGKFEQHDSHRKGPPRRRSRSRSRSKNRRRSRRSGSNSRGRRSRSSDRSYQQRANYNCICQFTRAKERRSPSYARRESDYDYSLSVTPERTKIVNDVSSDDMSDQDEKPEKDIDKKNKQASSHHTIKNDVDQKNSGLSKTTGSRADAPANQTIVSNYFKKFDQN